MTKRNLREGAAEGEEGKKNSNVSEWMGAGGIVLLASSESPPLNHGA